MTDLPLMQAREDQEKRALMCWFLAPRIDQAESWDAVFRLFAAEGYACAVDRGHLAIRDRATGRPICHGDDLGQPLSRLCARLGPDVPLH